MLCPSCSAAALDMYGRCPHCGYAAAPPAQPYTAYAPQPALITPTAPAGLGLAAQILMAVAGLLALVAFGANIWTFGVAKTGFDAGFTSTDDANAASAVTGVFGGLGALLALATGVVFIVWLYKSAKLAEILAPGRQSLTAGWAIGGWFIPLAYYVLPRLVAGGVWRAAIPLGTTPVGPVGPYGAVGPKPRTYLVTWWWLTFIVGQSLLFMAVNSTPGDRAPSVGALVVSYGLSGLGDLFRVTSAVLGILMVRKLTSMQQVRILQGPGVGHPYAAPVAESVPYAAYVDQAAPAYPGVAVTPADPYAPAAGTPYAASQPQPVAPTVPVPVPSQAAAPQEEALPATIVEPSTPSEEAPAAEPQDAVPADVPTAVIPRQAEDRATVVLAPQAAEPQPDAEPQDAVPTDPKDA